VGEGGRVLAFEPLPANAERIRRNAALNPEGSRLELYELAVSNCPGTVHFRVHSSNAMGRMETVEGRTEGYTDSIEVTTAGLDDLVYERGLPVPDVIKMDIEGGEVLALPGAVRLLAENHPLLLLELHGPQAAKAAWELLKAAGYRLFQLGAEGQEIQSVQELDWKAYVLAR
jgi:FkbM family methyltransferase